MTWRVVRPSPSSAAWTQRAPRNGQRISPVAWIGNSSEFPPKSISQPSLRKTPSSDCQLSARRGSSQKRIASWASSGVDVQPQPRVGQAAELAQGGHDDGPIAAGGFFRTVIGRHFRQDEAGQGFLDFQREQAHGGRFARLDGEVQARITSGIPYFPAMKTILPPGASRGMLCPQRNPWQPRTTKSGAKSPNRRDGPMRSSGSSGSRRVCCCCLSLVKYSPADLPELARLPVIGGFLEPIADKSGAPGENLIGPVGGILGFLQILLFGAASYLMPVGFHLVRHRQAGLRRADLAAGGDGILHPAVGRCRLAGRGGFLFHGMGARAATSNGPGGVIGNGVGGFVLTNVIGRAGTLDSDQRRSIWSR